MGCICAKQNNGKKGDGDPTPEDIEVSTEQSTEYSRTETEYSYTETEHSTTDPRTTVPPPSLFVDDEDDEDGPLGLDLFGQEDSVDKDEVVLLGVHEVGGTVQESSDVFTPGDAITFIPSKGGDRKSCRVMSKIGEGSFGEVYKVTNTLADEVYALKVPLQQSEQQTSTETFNDKWEQLIGKRFGKTEVEPGTVNSMSVQLMTLGTPLEAFNDPEKADLFFEGSLGLFDQLGQMHGTKTGSLTDGIEDGFVHLDIADRNFLIVDGKVSLIDFGLAKHASTPILEDEKEHHIVDGKPEVKRGPQYEILITNLTMWAEAMKPTFDEDDIGRDPIKYDLAKNLSAKTMEALILSGYILKNMLPDADLGVYLDRVKFSDTLFQKASKVCQQHIKENKGDQVKINHLEWQAMKLADFCQDIVEKAKRGPVHKDASAFLEFMTVDKTTSHLRER